MPRRIRRKHRFPHRPPEEANPAAKPRASRTPSATQCDRLAHHLVRRGLASPLILEPGAARLKPRETP